MSHSIRDQYLKYLHGNGLEIGALNLPTQIPKDCHITYSDIITYEQIKKTFPNAVIPQIISNSETFPQIKNNYFDFIIANHVLEHITSPINALIEWNRILKRDGIIFLTLPDKRFTFDHQRLITPLNHLLHDYHNSKAEKDINYPHLLEWAQFVEKLKPNTDKFNTWVKNQYKHGYNVHNHVWTIVQLVKLIQYINGQLDQNYEIVDYKNTPLNNMEFILILKKSSKSHLLISVHHHFLIIIFTIQNKIRDIFHILKSLLK